MPASDQGATQLTGTVSDSACLNTPRRGNFSLTKSPHQALCKQKRPRRAASKSLIFLKKTGAGEGIRTLDPNLGKVVLYP